MTTRHAVRRRLSTALAVVAALVSPAAFAADDAFDGEAEGTVPDAVAARDGKSADGAPRWNIGPARILPPENGPYAIDVNDVTYWVFPVAFQPRAAEDMLRDVYDDIVANMDARNEADEAEIARIEGLHQDILSNEEKDARTDAIRARMKKRRDELPAIDAQLEILRAEIGKPRHTRLAATLHAGDRVFGDTADEVVRNVFERRGDVKYYTAHELARVDLNDKTALVTRPSLIHGRRVDVVDVLLVFPKIESVGPRLELRLGGLGNTAFPRYEPGALAFLELMSIDDPSTPSTRRFYDPAMRQTVRIHYDVSGGALRPAFRLDRVDADWLWLWAARLRAGHVRTLVDVRRGDAGPARNMRYVPVLFVNDTARPQPLAVKAAGLYADVVWQGLPIRARFTDGADANAYWDTLLMRAVRERVDAGEEYNDVRAREAAALPGVDPEPDLRLKAAVLPPEGLPRLPKKETLAPRTRRPGILSLRTELDNLDEILDGVKLALGLSYLLEQPVPTDEATGAAVPLFAAYRALYPARPDGLRDEDWIAARPPEIGADRVERLVLAHARASLAERRDEPAEADFRAYNHHRFAPLAPDMVIDWPTLARRLLEDPGAAERVRAQLSGVVLDHLRRLADGSADDDADLPAAVRQGVALDALNAVFAREFLFGAAEYEAVRGAEIRELLARGRRHGEGDALPNLTPAERLKAHRLIFDEAMTGAVEPCLDRALLGRLLNGLADDHIQARMADGHTDLFFDVVANDGPESATLALDFRRFVPPLFPAYEMPDAIIQVAPGTLDPNTAPDRDGDDRIDD